MRRRLRSRSAREDGIAMVLVVLQRLLTLLSVTLIDVVRAESDRGAHANSSAASFQAAEAGLDDYIAKLADDHGLLPALRASGRVDAGRRQPGAKCRRSDGLRREHLVSPRGRSRRWHYAERGRTQRQGSLVQLRTATSTTCRSRRRHGVDQTSAGRRDRDAARRHDGDMRAIEDVVRPSTSPTSRSIASERRRRASDGACQRLLREDLRERQRQRTTRHGAYADIFARGDVNRRRRDAAARRPDLRPTCLPHEQIKNHPIDFTKFLVPSPTSSAAAQAGGVVPEPVGQAAWRLIFHRRTAPSRPGLQPCTAERVAARRNRRAVRAERRTPCRRTAPSTTDVTAIVSGAGQRPCHVASSQNIVVASNIALYNAGRRRARPDRATERRAGWPSARRPARLAGRGARADGHLALAGSGGSRQRQPDDLHGLDGDERSGGSFTRVRRPHLRLRPDSSTCRRRGSRRSTSLHGRRFVPRSRAVGALETPARDAALNRGPRMPIPRV